MLNKQPCLIQNQHKAAFKTKLNVLEPNEVPKLRRVEHLNCAAYKWFIIRLKGKSEGSLYPLLKKVLLFL